MDLPLDLRVLSVLILSLCDMRVGLDSKCTAQRSLGSRAEASGQSATLDQGAGFPVHECPSSAIMNDNVMNL